MKTLDKIVEWRYLEFFIIILNILFLIFSTALIVYNATKGIHDSWFGVLAILNLIILIVRINRLREKGNYLEI